MRLALFALALSFAGPIAAQEPARLYRSDEPLALTLRSDFKTAFKDRDTTRVDTIPARLTYVEPGGDTVAIDLGLTTRGNFRLRRSTCSFPPLLLMFPDNSTKGTLFRGDRTLRLVTHCEGRDAYQQYVLREYLAYRILNLLTEKSLRVRLARVTYVDPQEKSPTVSWAFFREDDDDMARRNEGKILEYQGLNTSDAPADYIGQISLFQYMIANTDFSIPGLHNIKILQTTTDYYPVPYDLDWAGLVNAPYAKPDYRLPIRIVTQRLYRGACTTPEKLAPAIAVFNDKRPAIEVLVRSIPGLDQKSVSWSLEYIGEFYDVINDPSRLKREIGRSCP